MPPRPVRTVCLALALTATGALTACASGTVSGHGSAGAVSPGSGASNSGDFPSASISISVPVPPASTPVVTDSVPPSGDGVLVTEAAGHYEVRMPAAPERTVQNGSIQNYKYTLYLHTVKSPYLALVEGEVVEPALPESQIDATLGSAVSSFQSSSGMTLISQKDTSFNGHTAKSAILDHSGDRYELLVAAYSGAQIYLLFAPEGARFDALASSFRAI